MIELKVGDRVSINGYACCLYNGDYEFLEEEKAVIKEEIESNMIYFRLENGSDSKINYYNCHRKQVRKLVKVRKCNYCIDGWIDQKAFKRRCEECNGKGKVKIDS